LLKVVREGKESAQSITGEPLDIFLAVSVPTTGLLDASRAQQVQSMVVRLTAPPGFEFQPRSGQTLVKRDATKWTIRIDACPSPDTTGDKPLSRFTSCTPEYPCDVKWIRQLAADVSGERGEGVLDRVLAISRWIHQEFRYELAGGDLLVERVLKEKKGDCLEYSKAMITLLRAREIPARLVSGLVPAGSDPQVFGFHAWVQAWIPGTGWVYFDPTWGTHPVDASHIALEQDNSLQSTSFIGALSLEILEASYGTSGAVPTCP
jgi:transglutaminase-like putative cysteine protease